MAANRHFVLAALLIGGSVAHAAPGHRKPAIEASDDADDAGAASKRPDARAGARADAAARTPKKRPGTAAGPDANADADAAARAPKKRPDTAAGAEADATPGARKQLADAREPAAPEDITDARRPPAPSPGWTFAIGPYVWASSVQANVSLGSLTAGVDIGFLSIVRHTRYGGEALMEARRGRFGISADVMYGEAAIDGSTEIASVMATFTGKAGSLLLDSAVGYDVLGDEASAFSLEARPGVRYQRTTIQGQLSAAGIMLQTPELVEGGTDLLLGARATLRPAHWAELSGAFDIGVAGSSDRTWSYTVDAAVHVASWLRLAAGWRSMTTQRSSVSIEMSGPRIALQLVL
jgi:hypothetical protein